MPSRSRPTTKQPKKKAKKAVSARAKDRPKPARPSASRSKKAAPRRTTAQKLPAPKKKASPVAARARPEPRPPGRPQREKARAVQVAEKALEARRKEKVLLSLYERALKALYARDYQQAMDLFEKLIEDHSDEIELVDRARNFVKICQSQGATRKSQQPRTAEEMFDAGVLEHNRSNFQKAIDYFSGAIQLHPKGEYIYYALAASYAQLGQTEQAMRSLNKSIQLNPKSRFHARNDPDFEPVRSSPEFASLIEIPKT